MRHTMRLRHIEYLVVVAQQKCKKSNRKYWVDNKYGYKMYCYYQVVDKDVHLTDIVYTFLNTFTLRWNADASTHIVAMPK